MKIWLGCFLLIILLFNSKEAVLAVEVPEYLEEEIDYEGIQSVIDDMLGSNQVSFGELVGDLFSGKMKLSGDELLRQLKKSFSVSVKKNVGVFSKLISLALISAVFTNLAMAFRYNQVAETGFYIAYLLTILLIVASFVTASSLTLSTLNAVIDFMKALIPSYFMSVAFCTGSMSSIGFYQATLVTITIVNYLFVYLVIPLIQVILLLNLANNLSKEDMLSKLSSLLENTVGWLLKSLLAIVIGFQTIQGMIIPVADKVKRSFVYKASEAIPGIGNVIGSVTETVFSAGALLKNSIGVAGLIIIIIIVLVPIIKLLIITLIYRFSGAVLQPISDKRILDCLQATARSCALLLQTVFIAAVLFMITITIVAITTRP